MPEITAIARKRIEAQGFVGIDDATLIQINHWLRFSPTICLVWTAFGVVLASPIVLWSLVPFALLGGILRGHPFDLIYNYGLRHIFKTPHLPSYGLQRRFACLMASVIISLTALCFQFDRNWIGYLTGGLMIFMASANVTTGFCVPSFLFSLIFGETVYEIDAEWTHPRD